MGETSLLVFSICLQAAIGIMLFAFVGEMIYKDKRFKLAALFAAVLAVAGVFASFAHLGHPLSALNVLGNFGKSWLSNEAVLAGVFAGLAVLYVLILYLGPNDRTLSVGLSGIGSLLGLAVVFSMAKVYANTAAPMWQGTNTFVDFYATTIALGALLFLAASFNVLKDVGKKVFGYAILAAVVIQAASSVPHILNLNQMGVAAQSSVQILNGMSVLVWMKWFLILGGAGLLLRPASLESTPDKTIPTNLGTGTLYTAGTALILGQIIGRYLFYAALVVMNVGLV